MTKGLGWMKAQLGVVTKPMVFLPLTALPPHVRSLGPLKQGWLAEGWDRSKQQKLEEEVGAQRLQQE